MNFDSREIRSGVPTRIVIVGFMGAGKSSVARELARLLDDAMIDLDDSITRREGRTPQQLIDEEGEPRFREIETRALESILAEGASRIVALGGGAWTVAANRELVARYGCLSIWLDATFDLCWRRILRSRHARPLARDHATARRLYDARRELYALADRRVKVGGKSVEAVAAEIEKLLRSSQDEGQTEKSDTQGEAKRDD
jgi:shikimate kinase